MLSTAFARHSIAAEIEFVSPGKLTERARAARERASLGEIDAIVAGGGDGSIRCVAEILAASGVSLAVLPLGTLNHFAKDLGIPPDLEGAIAVIGAANTKAIDVAEVNGRVFINNASIGIYPAMVVDREHRRKSGWQKWTAMALAAWRVLRHPPLRRLRIGVDGHSEIRHTPCLFIGNNPYALEARAFGKRDGLDHGALWLCVARQKTVLGWLWLALRATLGGLEPSADLEVQETKAVEVDARTSRLLVATDGEVDMMRPPLRFRIRPKDLIVFTPQTDPPCA